MPDKTASMPSCCQNNNTAEKIKTKGFFRGLIFGLIPHTFCILFIIFSIIGATAGSLLMKKFLILPYFFPALIALSIIFASLSAIFYLKRNQLLSLTGIKKSWKYLSILYGTTALVSVIFFYGIFPAVMAATTNAENNRATTGQTTNMLTIKVDIPCSGHGPLIIDELKKTAGVTGVDYAPLNTFKINYDPSLTNEASILSSEIFKTYKATKI
jgi:hypothetical protein